MKRYFFLLLVLPLCFSSCLRSLEKEGITAETIYKGRVIDKDNKPLNGIMVRITNGKLIHNSIATNADGLFQIAVDIAKIDGSYYIQVGEDDPLFNKKSSLKGLGQEVYDYGDIPFVNIYLPEFEKPELLDVTPSSFTLKCIVKSQAGAKIAERGLCWGKNIPTIEDNKEKYGSGDGEYVCTIKNDNFNFSTTTWYARAYAINESGDETYSEPVEINATKLAEFVALKLPVVETVGLTAMTVNSFTCKCNVKSQGKAIVTERGVCWSTNIPTVDDYKKPMGSGEGIYSCTVSDANINISTTTYYARAYAINEFGVSYGEPVEINSSRLAYFALPTMEYGGYTYHIHPDLGAMQWEQGFDACENLVAYGFDDWFMPNKEELLAVAEKTNVLNKDWIYWSSSQSSAVKSYFCYLKYNGYWFIGGNGYGDGDNYPSRIHHICPVRKDR